MDLINSSLASPHSLSDFTALLAMPEPLQKFEDSPYQTFENFSKAFEAVKANPFSLDLGVFNLILYKVKLSFQDFKEQMSAEFKASFADNIALLDRIYRFRSLDGASLPPVAAYGELHEAETIFAPGRVSSKSPLGKSIQSARETYLTFIQREKAALFERLNPTNQGPTGVPKHPNANGAGKAAAKSQTTALSILTSQNRPSKGKSPLGKSPLRNSGL